MSASVHAQNIMNEFCSLGRSVSSLEEVGEIVVDAFYCEFRFALEGLPNIDEFLLAVFDLADCKDEIVRLVQRGHDFSAADSDCLGVGGTAFDFYEAKSSVGTRL